jgi:hypothetical protein
MILSPFFFVAATASLLDPQPLFENLTLDKNSPGAESIEFNFFEKFDGNWENSAETQLPRKRNTKSLRK